ncbi:MAG TPA: class I SAM-dependent methyltransferase [Deltaproteobacteria bacterium]|nr:class I SAM-dependent methyltransferase [Deltaproteobacteria bacterium]
MSLFMHLNSTKTYHARFPVDLMTECTVCETLAHPGTPTARALGITRPYGALVGDFLRSKGLLAPGCRVLELGCGYGSLMEGLLRHHGDVVGRAFMADLSPRLVTRQRERLFGVSPRARHVMADIHELPFRGGAFDLVIVNEVAGDLDTIVGVDASAMPGDLSSIVEKYGLETPTSGPFAFNLGAVRLVEELCVLSGAVFLSEHSSDPVVPASMPYLATGLAVDSFPRRIPLSGHDEYTVRFSHLEKVARSHGRTVHTGPLIEVLGLEPRPSWRFIFTAKACSTEEQALIGEFLDHVREYRWLLIS